MRTLVVCIDRGDVARKTGITTPISGWEAVQSLVLDMGLADPEDSSVNTLLEALSVTRDLRDGDEEAIVAVVSGASDGVVGADRSVAEQVDALAAEYDPDAAIVVVDSADDERLVPIVESRLQVDSVDRVVVRQARDIESTYYLLKQFLGDEELRQTVLVPLGIVLLVFPAILTFASPAVAVASMTAVVGLFLLYKGLGVDDYLADVPAQARDALYSGRVSIVTYVVAAGLAMVGVFAGALGVSDLGAAPELIIAMAFAYDSVPWLALAALAAATGRLVDEAIREDRVRTSYLNLPFGVVAVGLVVRGFSAYFLERAGVITALAVPNLHLGAVSVDRFPLSPEERLALFVVLGVLISLVGIRVSTYLSGSELEGAEPVE
jgi:putative membrane protein